MSADHIITQQVQAWVNRVVLGLNLCPFAKREVTENRLRFCVSHAQDEEQLIADLREELSRMTADDTIGTTLLIVPGVLEDFYDYNEFLSRADALLQSLSLIGEFQIASFHPDYQFAGTASEEAQNYTNKSPYPLLHLLREASVSQAIETYPNADQIPARNIARLNSLGKEELQALLQSCMEDIHD